MKFKISLLLTTIVLMFATFSQAENCNAGIIDKAGIIRNTGTIALAAKPLVNQGVDVRVVTVDHNTYAYNGSNLAGVETALEASCPNWIDAKTGTRKANLFVVMVAPTDRQKNIFLGSYYAGAFDIPSTFSQLANPSFKAGQWEAGISQTLYGTGNRAVMYHQNQFAAQQRQRTAPPVRAYTATSPTPAYTTPQPTQTADSGMSGVAIFFLVLFLFGIVGTILYFVFRSPKTSNYTETTGTSSYSDAEFSTPSVRPVATTRRYAAAAPSTVVVHEHYDNSGGNLVTGMLIGEALSRPSYQPVQPVYVAPSPTYVEPAPTYTPDPTPVADAPDSTWEEPQQSAPDTNFDTPSYDPPSSDSGSSGDSGF